MVSVMAGNRRGWEGINMMTKQAFLDRKPAVKCIEISEWEDCVYIKKMTVGERFQLMKKSVNVSGKDVSVNEDTINESIVRACQLAICDDAGVRVFDDTDDDFRLLNEKEGVVLEMIFNEVMAFNGLGAVEEKEAIKN